MAIVLTQDLDGVPVDMIKAVSAAMGVAASPPKGLIVHTAVETGSGVRIVDVWESEQAYRTFEKELLAPTITKVSEQAGMTAPDAPPVDIREAFEVVRG
jgi:hypothetical protein